MTNSLKQITTPKPSRHPRCPARFHGVGVDRSPFVRSVSFDTSMAFRYGHEGPFQVRDGLGLVIGRFCWYCSPLTFSIQLTTLPSSSSWMARCDNALSGVAPCQCFSPGGQETTSPA